MHNTYVYIYTNNLPCAHSCLVHNTHFSRIHTCACTSAYMRAYITHNEANIVIKKRQTGNLTDSKTDRQTDIPKTNRQTDRQTDRPYSDTAAESFGNFKSNILGNQHIPELRKHRLKILLCQRPATKKQVI